MKQYYSWEEVEEKNKKCNELQKEYDFEIPRYILTELIKPSYDKFNVALLINMAVVNDRFTNDEGMLLKNKYCYIKEQV